MDIKFNHSTILRFTYILTTLILFSCSNKADKAIELNPKAIAYNDLAVEEIISINPGMAIKYLDSALLLEPNYPIAFTNKIAAFNQLNDYENALKTAMEYSKIPDFPLKKYAALAMCYERTGAFNKSLTYYKKALKHYEINDWQEEPLITQIDFAIFTTFVKGKESGLEKFKQIVSSTPPEPQDVEFIERIKNEIIFYQGGGYIEIIDNSNTKSFCVSKAEQESFEQALKEGGVNFEGWSSNNVTNQYRYKIKPKFASKVISIGFRECEN